MNELKKPVDTCTADFGLRSFYIGRLPQAALKDVMVPTKALLVLIGTMHAAKSFVSLQLQQPQPSACPIYAGRASKYLRPSGELQSGFPTSL